MTNGTTTDVPVENSKRYIIFISFCDKDETNGITFYSEVLRKELSIDILQTMCENDTLDKFESEHGTVDITGLVTDNIEWSGFNAFEFGITHKLSYESMITSEGITFMESIFKKYMEQLKDKFSYGKIKWKKNFWINSGEQRNGNLLLDEETEKNTMTLKNWKLNCNGSGYYLTGDIYGDEKKRFEDGLHIITSSLKSIDFESSIAKTKNSIYNLDNHERERERNSCKYCWIETDSQDPDVLCKGCRERFGHTFYSEL